MFHFPTLLARLRGLLGVTPRSVLAATEPPPCEPLDHEHPAWTGLLRKYVEDGAVDYAMMKAHGEPELATYLRSLEAVCPEDYAGFTREQRLAFWVNAYNAYTVRLGSSWTTIRSRASGASAGCRWPRSGSASSPCGPWAGRRSSLWGRWSTSSCASD
jgi:hypothetical protein